MLSPRIPKSHGSGFGFFGLLRLGGAGVSVLGSIGLASRSGVPESAGVEFSYEGLRVWDGTFRPRVFGSTLNPKSYGSALHPTT